MSGRSVTLFPNMKVDGAKLMDARVDCGAQKFPKGEKLHLWSTSEMQNGIDKVLDQRNVMFEFVRVLAFIINTRRQKYLA